MDSSVAVRIFLLTPLLIAVYSILVKGDGSESVFFLLLLGIVMAVPALFGKE